MNQFFTVNIKPFISPNYAMVSVFSVALLIMPLFNPGNYLITIIIQCMAFGIFGLCWNILGGYGSQISWCSAAFVAIGAYSNFIFADKFGISPFYTLPVGMALSFIFATLIGYGTFKLRGAYFSIATIAFAEALRSIIQYATPITAGSVGIWVTYRKNSLLALTFRNDTPFYYIFVILLFAMVFFSHMFTKSKMGYYLRWIKGDEDAAESLGIETFKVKLRAFQISAMMLSISGAFYSSFLTYISPFSTCSFDLSIKIGVAAIIGGISTLWGPVLGGFIVASLTEITGKLLGGRGAGPILYGLLLIIIVLFCPKGLIHLWNLLKQRLLKNTARQAGTP
jgi:branched-chain amino acid transport system permease protein